MANIPHSELSGSQLHEPKGVSGATSGQVYIADGSGSGTWTTQAGASYGGICLNDGAGSDTLGTIGTTAKQFTVFTDDMTSSGVVPDSTTDKDLVVGDSGTYLVSFSIIFGISAAGDAGTYQFRLRVNGSEPTSPRNLGTRQTITASATTRGCNFSGYATLVASDSLTVWIESDEAGNTDDIIVYECQLTAELKG